MEDKYFNEKSEIEGIRSPKRLCPNSYMVSKALCNVFPVVGGWVSCWVRNVRNIRIGLDRWINVGDNFRLSNNLIKSLHNVREFYLVDARNKGIREWGIRSWKSSIDLSLNDESVEWTSYVGLLTSTMIKISYED